MNSSFDEGMPSAAFLDDPLSSVALPSYDSNENDLDDFVPGTPLHEFGMDDNSVLIDHEQPHYCDSNEADILPTHSAPPVPVIEITNDSVEHEQSAEISGLSVERCTHSRILHNHQQLLCYWESESPKIRSITPEVE